MQCNVITAGDSPHILESIVKLRSRLLDVIEPDFKLLDELWNLTDAEIVSETGALAACLLTRRLTRRIDGENKPTGNVVITDQLPRDSSIHCVHRLPEVLVHTSIDEVPEVLGIWPHLCQV